MDFAALVSGGKDSVFAIMEAIAHGYQLRVVIHLAPKGSNLRTEEQDSYMYQSVASEGVQQVCRALNVPMIRRAITGQSMCTESYYITEENDEVEDLFLALSHAKEQFPTIKFVCSGAIMSDYQRVRVEQVASRLGLGSLAFLWRRCQTLLLNDMINAQLDAIIVKVASYGLGTKRHLGQHLAVLRPDLIRLADPPWCLNVCGEGGEYETFALDCPLFHERLVLTAAPEVVIHSADDEQYPVAYLRLPTLDFEPKKSSLICRTASDLLEMRWLAPDDKRPTPSPFLTPMKRLEDLEKAVQHEVHEDYERCGPSILRTSASSNNLDSEPPSSDLMRPLYGGKLWICRMCLGTADTLGPLDAAVSQATRNAVDAARQIFTSCGYSLDQVMHCWAVLNQPLDPIVFNAFNRVYTSGAFGMPWELDQTAEDSTRSKRVFPPTRACFTSDPLFDPVTGMQLPSKEVVAVGLLFLICPLATSEGHPILTGVGSSVRSMYVRSISHWAPANIGPYSQAISVRDCTTGRVDDEADSARQLTIGVFSGQIGLVPETGDLIQRHSTHEPDIRGQCWLALRHCHRLTKAMCSRLWDDLYVALCLGTSEDALRQARDSFHLTVCHLWFTSANGDEFSDTSDCLDPNVQCACSRSIVWIQVTDLPRHACVEWQWMTASSHPSSGDKGRILYTDHLTRLGSQDSLIFCDSNRVSQTLVGSPYVIACRGFLDRTESFAILRL